MPYIHLANFAGRDCTVAFFPLRPPKPPTIGVPGSSATFKRYLVSTPETSDKALCSKFSNDDYAEFLIKSDPDADIEKIGLEISDTSTVYLDSNNQPIIYEPRLVEVITNPDGSEKERRDTQDTPSNTNTPTPLRLNSKKIPTLDAIRKFRFSRSLQLRHTDGASFDFLKAIAKELFDSSSVSLLGAGPKGNEPLVFQANGRPYRAFLEGRVQNDEYMLLLHLSDMELRTPAISNEAKNDPT